MRPSIDHGVEVSAPTVKFPTVGSAVVGSLVSITEFQATDFATKQPLTWPSGDPQMNKRLRLVLVRSSGVEFNDDVDELDVVSVWLSGPRLYDYREAIRAHIKAHGATPPVGTMVEVKFDREEPSQTKGFAPRKVLSFRFRLEEPKDKVYADAAEAAYRAEQVPERPSAVQTAAPVAQVPYEEPF